MRIGIQGKLFMASVILTVLAISVGGTYLETMLRALLQSRVEGEVANHAQSARVAFKVAGPMQIDDRRTVDLFADQFGEASGTRITVIATDGTVAGDSEIPLSELENVGDHADRPEVAEALAEGVGIATRHSETLDQVMLYVAARLDDGQGVVRAAMPLTSVSEAVMELRRTLLWAGIVALAVTLLASALVSHAASRVLRAVVDHTRAVTQGDTGRMDVSSRDELGMLAGSINQLADDLQAAVSGLASERDRLQAILQGMREAVVVIDELNEIELLNPAARILLGVDNQTGKNNETGKYVTEAVGAPALPQLATAGGREPGGTEFQWRGRTLRAHASELRASRSRVFVLHDITETRRLDEMRRDFVANVSHELRTPVSVIRANSETLLDGALDGPPGQSRSFVEASLRNAERLTSLISDLLDLASIEGGGYPLEPAPLSLLGASKRVTEALQDNARRREIDLNLEVGPELVARADARAVDQVLVNLVANAIKYTHEGTEITIRARLTDDGFVRTEVEDHGPGLTAEHRARVFERFYRVDVGRSRALGGTGLGLSIAKHLISVMGGEIGVDSVSPNGCAFWFTLPVADPVSDVAQETAA